jgi:hypothetical protein
MRSGENMAEGGVVTQEVTGKARKMRIQEWIL